MIRCSACQTANLDTSRFCDECGSRLIAAAAQAVEPILLPVERSPDFLKPASPPAYVPPSPAISFARPVSVTSLGIPPDAFEAETATPLSHSMSVNSGVSHASLIIERGDVPGTEFRLSSDESTIGRWDADNGIFPDVDLDAHDSDAKVSRRHARIVRNKSAYFIEDLGSTNGTYVNRGRRLLPGNAQLLNDGDEIIVGKTFLRFQITH